MKKRTFFKFLLCCLFIFLLLPAVFDEEDKKPQDKSSFEEATSFDPSEDIDDIPIVEGEGAKESIFKKYSRKFKKMYGKVLFGVPAEEQDGTSFAKAKEQIVDDDKDLSSAMSYLLSDDKSESGRARSSYNEDYEEETMGALFYDSYTDTYVIGSSAPVKQTMHDNAPVKGLYETSFIESPESKVKANQVYSSVMRKVDTPSSITRGSAISEKKGVSVENLPKNNEFNSVHSNVAQSNNSLKTFNRQYTGISGRNSKDSGKSNRGGELYSYNKGSFGNVGGLGQLADMETVASHVAGRVSSAANTMKEERSATRANGGSDELLQGDEGNTADTNISVPQDNKPAEEKPFDASLYPEITATELTECKEDDDIESLLYDVSNMEESDAKEKTDPKSEVKTEGESSVVEDDIIKSCDKDVLFSGNQVRKEIGAAEGQNLVIVDLGAMNLNGKTMRRTLTADINTNLSVSGLHRIGIDNLTGGEKINNVFSAISDKEFKRYVRDYNKIAVIITNDPKVQQTYSNRAVLIQDGDLKSIEKLKSLAANLNQIDISAVRESLIAEAQEREKERSKQYKGDIAGTGKYITED